MSVCDTSTYYMEGIDFPQPCNQLCLLTNADTKECSEKCPECAKHLINEASKIVATTPIEAVTTGNWALVYICLGIIICLLLVITFLLLWVKAKLERLRFRGKKRSKSGDQKIDPAEAPMLPPKKYKETDTGGNSDNYSKRNDTELIVTDDEKEDSPDPPAEIKPKDARGSMTATLQRSDNAYDLGSSLKIASSHEPRCAVVMVNE